MTDTFLDAVVNGLQQAGSYSKDDQVPPVAVLWPDKSRQWEALIPRLRQRLPLLTLGPYEPEERTGPAYWLRCMIARALPDDILDADETPIIYLPGYSRQEIREVEDCPPALQPLAELQYRGVLWTQRNGRDWTLAAFLQTKDGGLEIEVSGDQATREALQRAARKLAHEPLARLRKAAPLRAPFFDALLIPDEARALLLWLDDPEGYPQQVTSEKWIAFCELCQRKYGVHPRRDGPIKAAQLLGRRYGEWFSIWERYEEAPQAYPNLPEQLRKARPRQLALFERSETWPQDNEEAERELRQQLAELGSLPSQEARAAIHQLEEQHGPRREWVWARLGRSPLSVALKFLVELAQETEYSLGGATLAEIVAAYVDHGWKADAAVLEALAAVEQADDVKVVKAAVRAVYRTWLQNTANAFQKLVASTRSEQIRPQTSILREKKGKCILFSDALRFDAGKRLATALEKRGYQCQVSAQLATLPTVTGTAKPAFSPIAGSLTGKPSNDLTPVVTATGTRLTASVFRKLLDSAGYQVLDKDELGDPFGTAWTELGAIDGYGHQHGWKVAHHILAELSTLEERVATLLEHGWAQVIVITDHGWLMLPDGLPKADLPQHLTVLRKGRCARLKPFSQTDYQIVSWFWDQNVRIATAPDIRCYEAGKEYEHGGLSPQECVVPVITVTRTGQAAVGSVGSLCCSPPLG